MDWETHIVLAGKLLNACALQKGAAIYSVLPVIDIEPIHYHRQYAHLLANQPLMVEIAGEIFATPEPHASTSGCTGRPTSWRDSRPAPWCWRRASMSLSIAIQSSIQAGHFPTRARTVAHTKDDCRGLRRVSCRQ